MIKLFITNACMLLVLFSCQKKQTLVEDKGNMNQPKIDTTHLSKATFGGGCFWCVEAAFDELKGVHKATSGYAGGGAKNPSYEQVATGQTNFAEVVQVEFDENIIPYEILLEVFWTIHDPTQLNRQGADVGPQYRSIILYETEKQKETAEKSIQEFESSGMYDGSFTTQLAPLDKFFTAEEYHQNYYENNASKPYCSAVIAPKIEKFRKRFKKWLKH